MDDLSHASQTELDVRLFDEVINPIYDIGFEEPSVLDKLIEAGANVNARYDQASGLSSIGIDGMTPLMFAVDADEIKYVEYFLNRKADLHAKDAGGNTVLMHAVNAIMPDLATIQLLCDRGIDIAARNIAGESALDIAKRETSTCKPEIIAYLAKKSALPSRPTATAKAMSPAL